MADVTDEKKAPDAYETQAYEALEKDFQAVSYFLPTQPTITTLHFLFEVFSPSISVLECKKSSSFWSPVSQNQTEEGSQDVCKITILEAQSLPSLN